MSKVGHCPECKTYVESVTVSFVSASPPGTDYPESLGMFFDDEMTVKKDRHDWTSINLSGKAMKNCPVKHDPEIGNIPAECAFGYDNFNWSYEQTYVIKCRCPTYYDDFSNVRRQNLCYCERMYKLGFSYMDPEEGLIDSIPDDLLNNGIITSDEKTFKRDYFSIKITNDEILQAIPWAKKFIHLLTPSEKSAWNDRFAVVAKKRGGVGNCSALVKSSW